MRPLIRLVVAAVVGGVAVRAHITGAAEPTADPLKGLSVKQAQERVVAAMKEWDAKLANLRYVVRERSFTDQPDGTRKVWDARAVEVRRHPTGHWMSQARFKAGEAEPYWEQITNVRRGRGARIFGRDRAKNEVTGGPMPGGEATSFRSFWFNQMTGFRIPADGMPRTVAAWVGDAARTPPRTVTCSAGVVRDRPTVAVAVHDGSLQTTTFYLDPARDWMIVRADSLAGTAERNSWSAIEVEKAERVGGVWFPAEVRCRSGITPSEGRRSEIRYTVEAVTVGKVVEADLDVPEPPKAAGDYPPKTAL